MHIDELLKQIQGPLLDLTVRVAAAAVIFAAGLWASKAVSGLTRRTMKSAKVDSTLLSFVSNLVYVGMMVLVLVAALGRLGVQTAHLVAVMGAAGLAVGLAVQGSLTNLSCGVQLILFKPFRVGDTIKVAGVEGLVKEIQVFTTVLIGPDNRCIIIPNSKITSDIIVTSPPGRPVIDAHGDASLVQPSKLDLPVTDAAMTRDEYA